MDHDRVETCELTGGTMAYDGYETCDNGKGRNYGLRRVERLAWARESTRTCRNVSKTAKNGSI